MQILTSVIALIFELISRKSCDLYFKALNIRQFIVTVPGVYLYNIIMCIVTVCSVYGVSNVMPM